MALVTKTNINEDALPSIADYTPSFGEYLGSAASDAWSYNPTVALKRASDVFESHADLDSLEVDTDSMDPGIGATMEDGRLAFDEDVSARKKAFSIDSQKAVIEAWGLTGKVQPHEEYTAESLRLVMEAKQREISNAMTREQAPAWMGPFGLAVGLGVGFVDPINIASGFLPVVSKTTQLLRLQSAGGAAGRTGVRAMTGLVEGAAGAAAIEPIIQLARSTEQADYEMTDSLMNIAFGSIMGAAMHAGMGGLGEWWRTKHGQRQEWQIRVRDDTSERLRSQMSEDIFQAAKDAGADKIGRVEADAASAIFDLHARQWAYDMGKTTEDFYKQFAPYWKAGIREAMSGDHLNMPSYTIRKGTIEEFAISREQRGRQPKAISEYGFDGEAGLSGFEVLLSEQELWHIIDGHEGVHPGIPASEMGKVRTAMSNLSEIVESSRNIGKYGKSFLGYSIIDGERYGITFEVNRDKIHVTTFFKENEKMTIDSWLKNNEKGLLNKKTAVGPTLPDRVGDTSGIHHGRSEQEINAILNSVKAMGNVKSRTFVGGLSQEGIARGNSASHVLSNLEEAVRLEGDGADAATIQTATGWQRDDAGYWRKTGDGPSRDNMEGGVDFQSRMDALDSMEGLTPADKTALRNDLQSGMLAERHQAIEDAVQKVRDGGMDKGPDVNDAVSGPSLAYREAQTLNQWQNIPEWQERLTNWMRNDGYTEAQIAEHVEATKGQMALYEALGAKISAEVVGSGQAKGGDNHGVKYSGPVRSNIDEIYLISFDLSSQCVKRLAAANTAAIAEAALGRPLRVEEQMALIALERAKGQEAPCVYCYVESNRAKARQAVGRARDLLETGNIPKSWSAGRKEAAKAAIDLFRAGGLRKEDINYNYVLDQNLRNTEAVAAIRGDEKYKAIYDFFDTEANATKQNQAKPYEEYTGELLNLTPEQVKMLNGYAGMRFFSTSDFQVEHVVDVIQAMWDMNAMGLKSHGYTKVPLYVDIFGDTGQKINMSCFAKVDPTTGEIGMDKAQGWDWNQAKEYRQQHPDVGIIFVCANDKILEWALAQDWIDYCIPFHFSGLEKQYYLQLGWQDFTSTQSESNIYATRRTRGAGFFDEAPEKIVTGAEQRELEAISQEKGVGEASKEYARMCFERRLFPVKPEAFFKPELIEGKNKPQRARAAKELWQQMIEDESFDPEMINPDYWTEFKTKGATTKEKTLDDLSVKRVRMHEIKFTMPQQGTPQHAKLAAWAEKNGVDLSQFEAGKTYSNETGMPDWMGTFAYLELCKERRIYPVFVNFMFKDYQIATLTDKMAAAADKKTATAIMRNAAKIRSQAEANLAEFMVGHPNLSKEAQAKFVENRIREAENFMAMDNTAGKVGDVRGKHVKLAKERWEDMVMSGEIDYDAINPNAYKVKKDYARTDTPFNVPDPRKINTMAASRPLRETVDQGLAAKYRGDPEVAEQLVKLARYGEESGRNIGSASLKALRDRQHPMAALLGEDASLESNSASLWQKGPDAGNGAKQKRQADAMSAQRRAVEEPSMQESPEVSEPSAGEEAVAKGRITFNAMEDGKALIEFFKAADATTAPHELYHLFRRQMAETAADPNAPQRVKDAYRQACEFVGAEPGKAWTVEQEEKFARAGERFLMEGKAPHPALQGLFDKMKQWFGEAYNSAEEAGLEISDGMRKLFADMLTSPTVDEAGAMYRYSMGRMIDGDPAEGIDTNVDLMGDNASTPEAMAEMQVSASQRVERSLESLQERMPESEITAFREEFEAAMRDEDAAIADVAKQDEMMREAAACDLGGM